MAAVGTGVLTLADLKKGMDPNGKQARIIEMLNIDNDIIGDMLWMQANNKTGHLTTVRTGLPSVTWRKLYGGTPQSASAKAQVMETCGMLTARSAVDKKLAELSSDVAAFRLNEAASFLEAMRQEFAQTLFYGDASTAPEEFTGLAARYSAISGATNGQNVLSAGGSGSDNTSVWLVGHGEQTFHGIYPEGTQAGLQHQDLGEDDVLDGSSNPYRALKDAFEWDCGVALRDWRYVVRICNIDVSDLAGLATTQAVTASTHILKMMTKAFHRIPSPGAVRLAFYANRTVREYLDIHATEKSVNALGLEAGSMQAMESWKRVPIRTCDSLLNTEAAVS